MFENLWWVVLCQNMSFRWCKKVWMKISWHISFWGLDYAKYLTLGEISSSEIIIYVYSTKLQDALKVLELKKRK